MFPLLKGDECDWLGGETEALEGFSWRGGSERDTTGILLWSKPYLCKLPDGEEVGIKVVGRGEWRGDVRLKLSAMEQTIHVLVYTTWWRGGRDCSKWWGEGRGM